MDNFAAAGRDQKKKRLPSGRFAPSAPSLRAGLRELRPLTMDWPAARLFSCAASRACTLHHSDTNGTASAQAKKRASEIEKWPESGQKQPQKRFSGWDGYYPTSFTVECASAPLRALR